MRLSSSRVLSGTLKLASSAGAIATVLALAGTAWTSEGPKKDEVFSATTAFGLNNTGIGNPQIGNPPHPNTTFFSFDISFVDPVLNKYFLADRSNKSIDILDLSTSPRPSRKSSTPGSGLRWQQRLLRSRRRGDRQ